MTSVCLFLQVRALTKKLIEDFVWDETVSLAFCVCLQRRRHTRCVYVTVYSHSTVSISCYISYIIFNAYSACCQEQLYPEYLTFICLQPEKSDCCLGRCVGSSIDLEAALKLQESLHTKIFLSALLVRKVADLNWPIWLRSTKLSDIEVGSKEAGFSPLVYLDLQAGFNNNNNISSNK